MVLLPPSLLRTQHLHAVLRSQPPARASLCRCHRSHCSRPTRPTRRIYNPRDRVARCTSSTPRPHQCTFSRHGRQPSPRPSFVSALHQRTFWSTSPGAKRFPNTIDWTMMCIAVPCRSQCILFLRVERGLSPHVCGFVVPCHTACCTTSSHPNHARHKEWLSFDFAGGVAAGPTWRRSPPRRPQAPRPPRHAPPPGVGLQEPREIRPFARAGAS